MAHYINDYWENRWNKTVVDLKYAERQLARIALLEMEQLPIPIEVFQEREPSYGIQPQS